MFGERYGYKPRANSEYRDELRQRYGARDIVMKIARYPLSAVARRAMMANSQERHEC